MFQGVGGGRGTQSVQAKPTHIRLPGTAAATTKSPSGIVMWASNVKGSRAKTSPEKSCF